MMQEYIKQQIDENVKALVLIIKYFSIFFGGVVVLFIGCYICVQLTYPSKLRHLYPLKFQSHPIRDLESYVRDWEEMGAQVYNSSLASMCDDVEVSSGDIAYCINEKNQIILLQINSRTIKKLLNVEKGRSYGLKLSRDEKLLYFVNSQLGLCELNIQSKKISVLVASYQNKPLIALNSIQTHPNNPEILYITESSSLIPLEWYHIDFLLNNPLGRLFEFNKETQNLSLVTDGLYFANGIAFQEYQGQQTVLVAETNRLRVRRVYIKGENRGMKQIAIQKLDMYPDNMKANQKGDIWIAGIAMRSWALQFADYHPWARRILSRMPMQTLQDLVNLKNYGGMKITFTNRNTKHQVEYFVWNGLHGFNFSTTVNEKNNKLYISSLKYKGVLVIDEMDRRLKRTRTNQELWQNDQVL